VRIVLADSDERFTADLVNRLEAEAEFAVVGTATTDTAALSAAARWSPDVALLDVLLPEHGGIQAIYGLKAIAPRCAVLILTQDRDAEVAMTAVRAGASGYLSKVIAVDELTQAIRAALHGEFIVGPGLAPGASRRPASNRRATAAVKSAQLSPREAQVLDLIGRGLSNREIAERLALSENTVRHHTTRIYQKLGITHRSQAVRLALSAGTT
jgi:DNA-binding NarL/FixJ family response regulator